MAEIATAIPSSWSFADRTAIEIALLGSFFFSKIVGIGDGRRVTSISERTRHTQRNEVYWHWGVGTMPLMDHGGRVPDGDAWSRDAAREVASELRR